MSQIPIISIIVPVHNTEKHLIPCLESLIKQTLADIEIICIDDCSSDDSPNIIEKYASLDNRIVPIYLNNNVGTSVARKTGVAAAKGQYIMFCDADDSLALNACETVAREMARQPVDILHFGTTPIYYGNYSLQEKKELENELKPCLKLRTGNLCQACFVEHRWNYTLWNKAYSAAVCKKAFSQIPDKYIVVSEDLYASFLISLYSTTYQGIRQKLYFYNFGVEINPGKNTYFNDAQFKAQCTRLTVSEELYAFAKKNNLDNSYINILNTIKNTAIDALVQQWRFNLSLSYAKSSYDYLTERLGASCIVSAFARQFWNDSEGILDRLAIPRKQINAGKKSQNIGVYYHRLRNGGAEKVLSELLFKWVKLGYNLVLFTDEEATDDDYPIPNNIKRIVLPDFRKSYCSKYKKRARFWENIIKTYNIDTILYHSCTCPILLWDVMLIKGLKCNLVIETHSMFCGSMWYDPKFSSTLPRIYHMVDRVVALSTVDVTFWNNYCPAFYIPNPINTVKAENMSALNSLNVLWVGRLADEKKPYAMLEAFSIVHDQIAEATLTMVGDGDGPEWLIGLQEYARKLGIENAVQFTGYELNTDIYYRKASVFVMTSISESFSMVLAESASYGIPAVMFELPNLELVQDNEGIIAVPQGDILALANGIITLLQNKELRKELGGKARSNLNKFLKFDISQAWKSLLDGMAYSSDCTSNPMYALAFELLLKNVYQGVKHIEENYSYKNQGNINVKYEEILNHHEEVLNRHEEVVNRHEEVVNRHEEVVNRHEEVVNRHEEVVNRHEEVLNRHEEVVNRHEEVVNRHEKSINHQWEVQKWHEERLKALEKANQLYCEKHFINNTKQIDNM